ncbi:MAG: class B sortase [Roseburia sp.]|nr:class B sortase [Roseburia sp.]
MNRRRSSLRLIRAGLILVMAVCLLKIGNECYLSVRHKNEQQELNALLRTEERTNSLLPWSVAEQGKQRLMAAMEECRPDEPAEETEPVILDKLQEIYARNNDLVGWLTIPGTVIDYPVMQCEDDEYYLHHGFYGDEDKYGCLYVRARADVNTPGTNFLIYGHNMKDGTMFGSLDEYRSKSFYEEHPSLYFDTLYEERTYEIVAVFLSQVYRDDEEVFKYYRFYQADTEEEFLSFYENIKKLSLYDTGVTAEYGDTFLTLSTCAYHVADGRLAVVAKYAGN